MPVMFFRNDDVRATLDEALINVTGLFIKHGIPITHAVEPANVSAEVVSWLNTTKKSYPELIEIMQHGYDHTIKNNLKKGEFGGQRSYQEQYEDISKGKDLMNKYFGSNWFSCFNFPYGPYNPSAIKAIDDLGYLVFNSHYNSRFSRRLFYALGHIINRGYFLNHHVSWNLNTYPNTSLFEIDMNFGFITKYIDETDKCELADIDMMKSMTCKYLKQKTIGVLIHHRYHNDDEKIQLIDLYLEWAKKQNYDFSTMKMIYSRYAQLDLS